MSGGRGDELVLCSQHRCRRGGWNGPCRRLKVGDGGSDAGAVWCRQGKCSPVIAAAAAVDVEGPKWWALTAAPGPVGSGK